MSHKEHKDHKGYEALLCVLCVLCVLSGCGRPSAANIALRKENQQLRGQLEDCQRKQAAAEANVRTLSATRPAPRLDRLYTVQGLRFGRLTGAEDIDPAKPGAEAVKVYFTPVDEDNQQIKAAGAITVELFDLSQAERPLVGRCELSADEARACWRGEALLYGYVVRCAFSRLPDGSTILVRVQFTDELTGRVLVGTREVSLK